MKELYILHSYPHNHILVILAKAGHPTTLKSLHIEHFFPHPAILDNNLTNNLIGPLAALSITASCVTGQPDPDTLEFWSRSQDLFSPNSLVNLHSLTMHSALPLGYTTKPGYCKVHFPNLAFLSLMGHLVGPNPAQEQEDPVVETFILSHKETLVSLELINCPILVRTEEYVDSLYQMADAFDAFREGLSALKTFTITQDENPVWDMSPSWDMRLEVYSKKTDEDGNTWNPRFCYAGLELDDQWNLWNLEDFKDTDYEPDWQRDRDALAALMLTVKSRSRKVSEKVGIRQGFPDTTLTSSQ